MARLPISGFQLCGMLRKASGYGGPSSSDNDPVAYLTLLADEGRVRLPFDPDGVFWIPFRIPVFSDSQLSLERSQLLSQLSMRSEDTGLVVDSLRRGGDAVYFARLVPQHQFDVVTDWVDRVRPESAGVTINSVDEFILVLATFKSFVVPPGVG